jgi:predicted nuclease with TOPRIM domain
MAVMMPSESWTDERLDYFEKSVGESFDGIKVAIVRLEKRMDERFEQVDKPFEQVDKRLEQIDKRFDQIDKRFEQVDGRFTRVETDIQELRRAIERQNTFMLSGFVGLAGLILSNAIFF